MLTRYCDQTPGACTLEEITHGLTTKMSGLTICLGYVTELQLMYLISKEKTYKSSEVLA